MDAVQKELRELPGTTVLIYDQTCAAEKRRRRKKKEFADPPQRLFINPLVCEGCGDCGVQSNCTSLLPLETDFGRKREIDQSSCNKDYSCVKGFCPSFVTVEGGKLRKSAPSRKTAAEVSKLQAPVLPALDQPFNILITGIGGTGVITIGALLGMAAHLEGKGASVLDMTGMSQKNGAVTSHVRIAGSPEDVYAQRIATGEADLILGCDMLTAASADAVAKTRPGRTKAVVNAHEQPPGQFARNPDWQFPSNDIRQLLNDAVGGSVEFVDATKLATSLLGDAIGANLFMLGFAYQRGAVPLKAESLMRAIELNGVGVEMNKAAFDWGRQAAVDLAAVQSIAMPAQPVVLQLPRSLDALVKQRVEFLTGYQNQAYAQQYEAFVHKVRDAERAAGLGDAMAKEVARSLFKLMAYKDEYEVARLYTAPDFQKALERTFEGELKLSFNLAPPILSKRDANGHLVKRRFGPATLTAFRLLAKLKGLRGTAFDPFGRTAERRMERALIDEYHQMIERLLPGLKKNNHRAAVEIARLPEQIRGFGHVKEAHVEKYRAALPSLLKVFDECTQPETGRQRVLTA
jgi:indolepyruvate ferredoxin oxidoreductase